MPIKDAAAALGISERTVWRRIKQNRLESRKHNGRALVRVEALYTTERHLNGAPPQPPPDPGPQVALLGRQVGVITQQLTALLSAQRTESTRQRWFRYGVAGAALVLVLGFVMAWQRLERASTDHAAALAAVHDRHNAALAQARAETAVARMEIAGSEGREAILHEEIALLRAAIADNRLAAE